MGRKNKEVYCSKCRTDLSSLIEELLAKMVLDGIIKEPFFKYTQRISDRIPGNCPGFEEGIIKCPLCSNEDIICKNCGWTSMVSDVFIKK